MAYSESYQNRGNQANSGFRRKQISQTSSGCPLSLGGAVGLHCPAPAGLSYTSLADHGGRLIARALRRARIYLYPTLLARRAAEIAQSQRGRLERDACGRPFVPETPPATAPENPRRFEWLIRVIRALTAPPASPGRSHSRRMPR